MTKKNEHELPTLESSLSEISELMSKMEQGDLTLQQSLNYFERGVLLVKHCQKVLQEAEQKVELLLQNQQKEELIPYSEHSSQVEE